ncbi:MAG TPA: hypothetical protein VHT75_09880 [Acidimicrobiales bacterium]|jgi:hypothetical protein|nr:hypothetical protein [Acidimicrobiales bacterium]
MTPPEKDVARRSDVSAWFAERLPAAWLGRPAEVELDREEVLVLLPLAADVDPGTFRDATRDRRIELARQAEDRFGVKVSWGTVKDGHRRLFTTLRSALTVPVGMPERQVLDALVDSGVAANRSEAVAWCIRLVGHHESDWLRDLRDAVAAAPPGRRDVPSPI